MARSAPPALAIALLWVGAADALAQRTLRTFVPTAPGQKVALYRYVPAAGSAKLPPVLLVPDFGFGHEPFDLAGRGLAPHLVAQGREVLVLEPGPRGADGRRSLDAGARLPRATPGFGVYPPHLP